MLFEKQRVKLQKASIRYIIFIYFTLTALAASIFIGISLYTRLSGQMSATIQEENQILINQITRSTEDYLRTVMKLSDSLYYGVIKNADLSSGSINSEITLLYDNNKDNVENIALLSKEGRLLASVPAARLKANVDVTGENWFISTLEKTENIHISTPHVQYIFDGSENQYRWVLSLSRAVEITSGSSTDQGVLLVDIGYNSLEQLFDGVNLGNGGYVYMISSSGEIIYHPQAQLIDSGIVRENNMEAARLKDGNYRMNMDGTKRIITVKTVGYTGWKVVGVTPLDGVSLNNIKTKLLVIFMIAFVLFIMTIINSYISSKITDPIKELEKSVNEIEEGRLDTEVKSGGSYEIQHLGHSIQNMARQIQRLMNDIVAEHESKRKSEFDTLQAQINPHFLYNTLDIIVWMIENENLTDAVRVVTALARFFRISLSKGKSIITVGDELEHVRNYLMIQHMRYKNKFTYTVEAGEEVLDLASLKLILQPLVENAIYHGMEFMDGDGEIRIKAWRSGGDLYMSVSDNGLGMTGDQVEGLFGDTDHVPSGRGSGIGVKNVNGRIKLYFGKAYGLDIESEPDEGTTVTAHLPAIPYSEVKKEEAYGK